MVQIIGVAKSIGVEVEVEDPRVDVEGLAAAAGPPACADWSGGTASRAGERETLAELSVPAGSDDDLAGRSTMLAYRTRDALLHVHPALERLPGPRLDRGGIQDLLAAAPTPAALRELGAHGIAAVMRPRSPRLATLPAQILAVLDTPTHVVAGTAAFARVISGVAAQLRDVHAE
ncbi:hypothetical protein [Pseudonocardia broussonetiae]|uniref:hypothetical protein n=1 Tax=Pseudonocardia broussonetiae TaxID=2736640 RepID=UPI001F03D327|nr:hypothetical protein [Pseudonocardia broussonetiae]